MKRTVLSHRQAVVGLLVLVVVATGGVFGAILLTRPAEPERTAWERVLSQIGPDGDVGLETALQAFSLAIGPLPGVAKPAGRVEEIPSGSGAVRWLMGHYDELTPEQQAAVDRYVTPAPDAIVVEPRTTATVGMAELQPAGDAPKIVLASARQPTKVLLRAPSQATAAEQYFIDLFFEVDGALEAQLGRSRTLPFTVTLNPTHIDPEGTERALAFTNPAFGFGNLEGPSRCDFFLNPELRGNIGAVNVRVVLAHEMFHCYQVGLAPNRLTWRDTAKARPWIVEGSAEWAGEAIAGPGPDGADWWGRYLSTPGTSLFKRGYDAVGFYQHIAERKVNVWKLLDKMLFASNEDAYHTGADPGGDPFLDTWASGFYRASWGNPWYADGPWSPSDKLPDVTFQVRKDHPETVETPPFTNKDWKISTKEAILHVVPNGRVRLGTPFELDFVATTPIDLCVDGKGCECPPGSTYSGPPLVTAAQPVYTALTGAVSGATIAITAQSLEDLCEPERPEASPLGVPGPGRGPMKCRQGCAASNGDPHIRTIDGHRYDFQAAGEFVLLRSPDGSVEIQARQEPYPGKPSVSYNTAVAARVNGQRVGITFDGEGFDLTLNGAPADSAKPTDLGSGAWLIPHLSSSAGAGVIFPDGTAMWAISASSYGISAMIAPADGLRSAGVGLVGPVRPGGMGVPALADGTVLASTADRHERHSQIYGRLADSWRVTAATTLFDYPNGRSTADYTVPGYPREEDEVRLDDLTPEQVAAGQKACGDFSDPLMRDQCIFDVAMTSDDTFALQYDIADDFVANGTSALDVPVASSSPVDGSALGSPPIRKIAAATAIRGQAVGPDGTLYVSIAHAGDQYELLAIDPASGAVSRRVEAKGGGRVGFAAGSVWIGEFTGSASCSITRLDPVSLAVEATIPTVCSSQGTELVASGDQVWWSDVTGIDADGKGAHLRRIDAATDLTTSDAVALPFAFGELRAAPGAIFYGDGTTGIFRLPTGATAFDPLGTIAGLWFPTREGIWTQSATTARLGTAAGGAERSLPIGGSLISADATGVYVARFDAVDASPQLWRYPVDGSSPVKLATGATLGSGVGQTQLAYFDNDPLILADGAAVKLWLVGNDPNAGADLYLQHVDLP